MSFFVVMLGLAFVASFPLWLPRAVVRLRMWVFTRINGQEGISVPGKEIGVERFLELYASPAARGRSEGARLSDLFWYWLSPGAEMHQEHLEPGARYDEVAQATRRILALPKHSAEHLVTQSARRILDARADARPRLARLRDLMMPVWADFYYRLVFQELCPSQARELIVGNANDVVSALKLTKLRDLKKRLRLTAFLRLKIERGEVPHALPESLSSEQKAFYLQGVFFNTAIVQMSEAMTHLLLFLSEHPRVQARLVEQPEDDHYLDRVITESLRAAPLFGVAHRITSDDIAVGEEVIPRGSVLCFDYLAFHQAGYSDPKSFRPERWEGLSPSNANYVPFGVLANRACPAQAVALVTMRAVTREVLRRYRLHSSAEHTRSIPNRGPCLLVPRAGACSSFRIGLTLAYLRLRDRWEDVGRSLVQLVLGLYMVWDARRRALCRNYFEQERTQAECPLRAIFGSGKRVME